MELEEILKMRFPHKDMQQSSDLSQESINEERKMADLVTKLVEKGLDINILIHDSAFKKLYDTIKSMEQDKSAIQKENERIKNNSINLTYQEENAFRQSHENDPFGLEFEYDTSEIIGYSRSGEYNNVPRTRNYNQKCSYSIGENGELIATSSLIERTGPRGEENLNKIGEHIITTTKKIGVKNEQALYSENRHEENYVVGTGVRKIDDSEKNWRINEFDTTLNYTEWWRGKTLDLNGNILEEHEPSRETITRNQDVVTATQYLKDGTKRIILCPYDELYLQPAELIINPSEEQIKETQNNLLEEMKKYGIEDYKKYKTIAIVDGKAEKDRFGIAPASSALKLLRTIDQTNELNEKAKLNQREVKPLEENYITGTARQGKIEGIKQIISEMVADGISIKKLEEELNRLKEKNIDRDNNLTGPEQ